MAIGKARHRGGANVSLSGRKPSKTKRFEPPLVGENLHFLLFFNLPVGILFKAKIKRQGGLGPAPERRLRRVALDSSHYRVLALGPATMILYALCSLKSNFTVFLQFSVSSHAQGKNCLGHGQGLLYLMKDNALSWSR